MRKTLLFIFILFSVRLFAQTNVYHAFPDSNAFWSASVGYMYAGPPPVGIQIDIWNWLEGDTVIGSYTYKKIGEWWHRQNDGLTSIGYVGSIRQDTNQKRIFFFNGNTDTLLYDFNLLVGDTLKSSYVNLSNSNIVSNIDSVLIGNSYHKRFCLTGWATGEALIEGVGSTMGLLLPLDKGIEHGSILNCYGDKGQNSSPILQALALSLLDSRNK